MSRSYRKKPICGVTTAKSEKKDKRLVNRLFRRASRNRIKSNRDPFYNLKEISDIWDFAKDGKVYYCDKMITKYPKILRK